MIVSTSSAMSGVWTRAVHGTLANITLAGAASLFAGYLYADGFAGSIVAIVPFLLTIAALGDRPVWPSDWGGRAVRVLLLLAISAVIIEPGWLNLGLAWALISILSFCERPGSSVAATLDALALLVSLPCAPVGDTRQLASHLAQRRTPIPRWNTMVLPVAASVVLLLLLASANPVIGDYVANFSLAPLFDGLSSRFLAMTVLTWLLLRPLVKPRRGLVPFAIPDFDTAAPSWHARFFAPGSVLVTLVALNALLALQNGLDLSYLWGGVHLPRGMTASGYAVRGAYQLIATALLAALFVIIALWPGSQTERSPAVRWLVYLWIVQNVLLVASSILRTLHYIDSFGMTEWRLAALLWMGLVAAGLILVCIRILRERTNLWLVNMNLCAAFLLLMACAFIDFKSAVASHNVSRALAGPMALAALDFAYLEELGPSALPALRRLAAETETASPSQILSRTHLANAGARRAIALAETALEASQGDWRQWTLSGLWRAAPEPGLRTIQQSAPSDRGR